MRNVALGVTAALIALTGFAQKTGGAAWLNVLAAGLAVIGSLVVLVLLTAERRAELVERRRRQQPADERDVPRHAHAAAARGVVYRSLLGLGMTAVAVILLVGALLFSEESTPQRGGSVAVLINVTRSGSGVVNVNVASCAQGAARQAITAGATLTITPVSSSLADGALETTIQTKLSGTDRISPARSARVKMRLFVEASTRIASVLKAPAPLNPSDIFDATAIIGAVLRQQPGPRTLVICGDVNQVAPGFNAYADNLSPARSRALISRLRPALPDLSSVDVAFGAVGLNASGADSPNVTAAIARWWTRYWTPAVHARSVTYGSILRLDSTA